MDLNVKEKTKLFREYAVQRHLSLYGKFFPSKLLTEWEKYGIICTCNALLKTLGKARVFTRMHSQNQIQKDLEST